MNRSQLLIQKIHEENLVGQNKNYIHDTLKTEAEAHSHESDIKEPRYQALEHYTDYGYKDMNARLRGQKQKIMTPHKMGVPKLIGHMKELTKNKTNHSFTAYRGLDHAREKIPEKGDLIHDRGFTSTSTDPEIAKMFAAHSKGVRYKIHIPENTKGFYASGHKNKLLMSEREFVLHPGTKFKVGDKGTDEHGEYTHLHIQSQED